MVVSSLDPYQRPLTPKLCSPHRHRFIYIYSLPNRPQLFPSTLDDILKAPVGSIQ